MANESRLGILIEARDQTKAGFTSAQKNLTGLESTASGLGGSMGALAKSVSLVGVAFAAIKVGQEIYDLAAAAKEQVIVERDLAAAIKSTGGAAGITSQQVLSLSASLQATTNYGDEATIAAQTLLLTFTKIGGDVFPRATQAAVDLSARFKQDLQSSILQVGKALNDPIAGLTALSRAGVQFSDSQKSVIEGFVKVGDLAAAQGVILTELETQVKGAAAAQVDPVVQLKNAWGDLNQEIGMSLMPTIDAWAAAATKNIQEVTNYLNDVRTGAAEAEAKLTNLGATRLSIIDELNTLQSQLDAIAQSPTGEGIVVWEGVVNKEDLAALIEAKQLLLDNIDAQISATGTTVALRGEMDSFTQTLYDWTSGSASARSAMAEQGAAADALRLHILGAVEAQRELNSITDQAESALRSSFKGVVGDLGVSGAVSAFQDANKEVQRLRDQMHAAGATTEEIEFAVAGFVQQVQSGNSELGKTVTAVSQIDKAFEDLKSKVAGVLSGALSSGINLDDILPRQDAIEEDARRLADVAVNGFSSPWASYLNEKFPDLFGAAFDGGDIKSLAAVALRDFEDGLKPELLNKEAAKERVRRMIMGEASMKELAEQITNELAQEMQGVSLGDIQSAVGQSLGTGDGGGAQAGQAFGEGFTEGLTGGNTGMQAIGILIDQITGQAALLKASGASNGKLWGGSFLDTVRAGVPNQLVGILVSFVLPEVLAAIQVANSAAGTVD